MDGQGTATIERRRHTRHEVTRVCKLRDTRTLRFIAGHTTDLSDSGAFIRIERDRPYSPGDELDVAVVEEKGGAVISSDQMKRAIVRRVVPIDYHNQAIAVEFRLPPVLKAAA